MSLAESPPDRLQGSEAPVDLGREWLETDGAGGYASSTPSLCPTRRYHGLLVTPTPGTAERTVFLARYDETLLTSDGARHSLSVARYGSTFAPRGDLALVDFQHAPHPRAEYRVGGHRMLREVRLAPGTSLVRYTLLAGPEVATLEAGPLLPFRRADALTVENDALDPRVEQLTAGIRVRPYAALPALALTVSRPAPFAVAPTWYRDLRYGADEARGYGGGEDQFRPGTFAVELRPGESVVFAASVRGPVADPEAAWTRAARPAPRGDDPLARALDRAADDFLQRTPEGRLGVVAGYPWFLEWGRDTFLALPGLTLARGRVEQCGEVLTGALPYLKDGLLPNIFGAGVEDSHYGSADAALWFARAALLYRRAGGADEKVLGELEPALESIAEAYLRGTDLGLFVDDEGLLHAGAPEHNPTWMDARVAAGPVTPRHGCPVEIAALWCSLLAQLEELARTSAARREWRDRKRLAKRTFLERLWLVEHGHLADNWRDGVADTSVRPNMVLAAALELAPLTKAQRKGVVRAAKASLLTPVGLRTLAPDDPAYRPRFEGGPEERDGAYHQGTVWPWLLGAYVEATLRSGRPTKRELAELRTALDGLEPELARAGLGHVSEVFDGDEPRRPGGTVAQAWNTAEWLRARRMLGEGTA